MSTLARSQSNVIPKISSIHPPKYVLRCFQKNLDLVLCLLARLEFRPRVALMLLRLIAVTRNPTKGEISSRSRVGLAQGLYLKGKDKLNEVSRLLKETREAQMQTGVLIIEILPGEKKSKEAKATSPAFLNHLLWLLPEVVEVFKDDPRWSDRDQFWQVMDDQVTWLIERLPVASPLPEKEKNPLSDSEYASQWEEALQRTVSRQIEKLASRCGYAATDFYLGKFFRNMVTTREGIRKMAKAERLERERADDPDFDPENDVFSETPINGQIPIDPASNSFAIKGQNSGFSKSSDFESKSFSEPEILSEIPPDECFAELSGTLNGQNPHRLNHREEKRGERETLKEEVEFREGREPELALCDSAWEETDPGDDALDTLEAFAKVGASDPLEILSLDDVTRKFKSWTPLPGEAEEKFPEWIEATIKQERSFIPRMMGAGEERFRPLIQIDDCRIEHVRRLDDLGFVEIETSPGNWQVWLALPEGTSETERDEIWDGILRALNPTNDPKGPNKGSAGSVRWPGSKNFKPDRGGCDVILSKIRLRRRTSRTELQSRGLFVPPPEPQKPVRSRANAKESGSRELRLPDYEREFERFGGDDRSKADQGWSVICAGMNPGIEVEQLADALLEVSDKARERRDSGDKGERDYARLTARKAIRYARRELN